MILATFKLAASIQHSFLSSFLGSRKKNTASEQARLPSPPLHSRPPSQHLSEDTKAQKYLELRATINTGDLLLSRSLGKRVTTLGSPKSLPVQKQSSFGTAAAAASAPVPLAPTQSLNSHSHGVAMVASKSRQGPTSIPPTFFHATRPSGGSASAALSVSNRESPALAKATFMSKPYGVGPLVNRATFIGSMKSLQGNPAASKAVPKISAVSSAGQSALISTRSTVKPTVDISNRLLLPSARTIKPRDAPQTLVGAPENKFAAAKAPVQGPEFPLVSPKATEVDTFQAVATLVFLGVAASTAARKNPK